MQKIIIALVRTYQVATSNFAPRCKYYPSCSNYAITAIGRYGFKGIAMASWRIVRCNPWSQGGVDYVDEHLDCADVKNLVTETEKIDSRKEVVGAN
jgi:putative membrane protein insertion efficiency factor